MSDSHRETMIVLMKSRANPFVMCVIATSFCFRALSPLQAEQQLARGYVFHDRNIGV